jgi:hypothetical protein
LATTFLFLTILLPLLKVSQAGTAWNIETVDSAANVGTFSSLALDSNNDPHISYRDSLNHDLKYAKWTGTNWSTETVDSAGDVGRYSSLALDSNNDPHISYHDYTNGDLKYAKWTGTNWNIQTVTTSGSHCSLALDPSYNPHISYSAGNLKYAFGQSLPPIGSIVINNGDACTTSTGVTLTLTYTAYASSVSDIRLSNDGIWDTETWESPTPSKAWMLESGDGTKTVYSQVRDSEGMVSSTYSDTIVLDTTPPIGTITINGGNASTASTTVTLSLYYADSGSGVSEVRYSNDGVWDTEAWETPILTKSWTLISGEGTKTVYCQIKDNVEQVSLTYSDTILIESQSASPSPSPSPTPNASTSPTPTSGSTPTPSATTSPSISPTPTGSTLSTPTASPSPSPTSHAEEPLMLMYIAIGAVIGSVAAIVVVVIFLRKGK